MLFIDVGCSGGVPPRWRQTPKLKVFGFDISEDAINERRLNDTSGKYIYGSVGHPEPEADLASDYSVAKAQCYTACHILKGDIPNEVSKYLSFLQNQTDPTHAASSSEKWQKNSFIRYYQDLFSGTTSKTSIKPPELIKLDDVIELSEPAVLKIDTDGSELRVLETFKKGLGSPFLMGVEIECQLRGVLSASSSTFSNIDTCLRAAGFVLWEFEPVRYQRAFYPATFLTSEPAETMRGQVQFANVFYVRLPKMLLSKLSVDRIPQFKEAYLSMAETLSAVDLMIEFAVESRTALNLPIDYNELDEISLKMNKISYKDHLHKFLQNPKSFYAHYNPSRIKTFLRRVLNKLLRLLSP